MENQQVFGGPQDHFTERLMTISRWAKETLKPKKL
jgi:hypothetical protein